MTTPRSRSGRWPPSPSPGRHLGVRRSSASRRRSGSRRPTARSSTAGPGHRRRDRPDVARHRPVRRDQRDRRDSSSAPAGRRGPTDTFYVNSVVKGFTDGLIGKHAGDRVLICVPAKDAFGDTGNLAVVGPAGRQRDLRRRHHRGRSRSSRTPTPCRACSTTPTGNPSKFTADDQVTKNPTDARRLPGHQGHRPGREVG